MKPTLKKLDVQNYSMPGFDPFLAGISLEIWQ